MQKTLLQVLLLGGLTVPVFGQKVILKDSTVLFETIQDMGKSNQSIPQQKGYVASIYPKDSGYRINVFKHYQGYLEIGKGGPKDYRNSMGYLPGLAQLTFSHAGLKTEKEKIFHLAPELEEPYPYTFFKFENSNIFGSKASYPVLSNAETGGNYGVLLEKEAEALEYSGLKKTLKVLSSNAFSGTVQQTVLGLVFNPFLGQYIPDGSPKSKVLVLKTEPKFKVTLAPDAGKVHYVRPLHKGSLVVVQVNEDLVEKEVAKVQLPADHSILGYSTDKSTPRKEQFSLTQWVFSYSGFTLLTGNAHVTKGGKSYTLLNFDADGNLKFRHDFEHEVEGYSLMNSQLLTNQKEGMVQLTFRKGLRGELIFVKYDEQGVKYKYTWENADDKAAKVINAQSGTYVGGRRHAETYLLTLENGENAIFGPDYGGRGPGGVQVGYGLTHLGADGKAKAFYGIPTYIPNSILGKTYDYAITYSGEGKVLLVANEPRGTVSAPFVNAGTLKRAFSPNYSLVASGDSFQFASTAAPAKDNKVKSGLLKGFSLEVGGSGGSGNTEVYQKENTGALLYAPALFVVDVNAQKIKALDLRKEGGYSLPEVEHIWIKRDAREVDAFLRRPEAGVHPNYALPKVLRLNALKVAY